MFNTVGDSISTVEDAQSCEDTISTMKDTISTVEDIQYCGGKPQPTITSTVPMVSLHGTE